MYKSVFFKVFLTKRSLRTRDKRYALLHVIYVMPVTESEIMKSDQEKKTDMLQ